MELDSFLVSLYVQIDDWWMANHPPATRRPGRPALLSDSEVLTLAILAQWPRFRSERNFWRFASSHLRPYFPMLCSQGQLNRRVRALEPELRLLQGAFAEELSQSSAVYRVMDTTLIPAIVRVRASRKGLFAGQASFGRSASKTEWVYGFKVALVVDPEGVITEEAFVVAAHQVLDLAHSIQRDADHDQHRGPAEEDRLRQVHNSRDQVRHHRDEREEDCSDECDPGQHVVQVDGCRLARSVARDVPTTLLQAVGVLDGIELHRRVEVGEHHDEEGVEDQVRRVTRREERRDTAEDRILVAPGEEVR
jgi:hypothetical protein